MGPSVGTRVQSQAPQSTVQSPLYEGKDEKPLSTHKDEEQGENPTVIKSDGHADRKHAANPNFQP